MKSELYGRALVVIAAEQYASRLVVPQSQQHLPMRCGSCMTFTTVTLSPGRASSAACAERPLRGCRTVIRHEHQPTIAKALPLTHALALLRYGIVDPSGKGLHDIWG